MPIFFFFGLPINSTLLILFLVKNFEEKEIEFLKERFCQKLPSNYDNNWAFDFPINCTSEFPAFQSSLLLKR